MTHLTADTSEMNADGPYLAWRSSLWREGGRRVVIRLAVALLWSLGVVEPASCQELDPPDKYKHPGTRYIYQDPTNGKPARWERPIVAQFFGLSDTKTQTRALSLFLQYAEASGYEARIAGFPDSMFTQSVIDENTNLLVLEAPSEDMKSIERGDVNSAVREILPKTQGNEIRWLFKKGLAYGIEGCRMRWNASSDNVINASVVAYSSDLPVEQRQECVAEGLSRAFGIFPYFSIYTIPLKIDGAPVTVRLEDESELLLELMAYRVCREQAKTTSNRCPFIVVNDILSHHGELAK